MTMSKWYVRKTEADGTEKLSTPFITKKDAELRAVELNISYGNELVAFDVVKESNNE